MTSQMDDSNMEELHNSKTEELLKMAGDELNRVASKKESLNSSKRGLVSAPNEESDPALAPKTDSDLASAPNDDQEMLFPPPVNVLERSGTTVGEIAPPPVEGLGPSTESTGTIGTTGTTVGEIEVPNNAIPLPAALETEVDRDLTQKRKTQDPEESSNFSEESVSLRSAEPQLDISMRSRDTLGADTIQSREFSAELDNNTFPSRSEATRVDHSGTISSPNQRPSRNQRVAVMETKRDDDLKKSNHSQDGTNSSREITGHSRGNTSTRRGRRASLGAYKVPGHNKPKGGGGFVTVKRRYQPRRASGVVPAPRRISAQGYHVTPSGHERAAGSGLDDDVSSASSDRIVPPPALNMSQSMLMAVEELRLEKEREEAAKASRKEPKGWLYLTALFTLVSSTGGLLIIVLYAFGAAFGDVYTEARSQLEYLSTPGSMDDESTPQYAALEWLVREDRINGLDLVNDAVRREARYSLAVLYYSTEGEVRWTDDLHFLSNRHECDWNVEMETGENDGNEEEEKSTKTVGVVCDDDRSIVQLSIVGNNLRGQLPQELTALSDLIALDFQDNELTGTIPDWKWDGLESLHLQHNSLEGSIPDSLLTQSPLLRSLDLSSNELSSSIPNSMRQMSSIESINLGYNDLTGNVGLGPNELLEDDDANADLLTLTMPTLRTFNVTNNKMRGSLDFVEIFPSLQVLDVTQNGLTGRIPGVLGGLTNLEALYLSDNQFFGVIPTAIGSLDNLTKIVAANNLLNRQFPWDSFDADNRLTEIILSHNSLTGTLPENMGTFSSLEVVDFGQNLLAGSIPPSIAQDTKLRILRLSRNQFDGPLPAKPTALPESLEIIDIHSNQFSGGLPVAWANFTSLSVLTLHDNSFEGPIPPEWGQLSSLERITLHLNRLVGSVDFMCDMQPQPSITANCAGIRPQVNCSCCTLCLE